MLIGIFCGVNVRTVKNKCLSKLVGLVCSEVHASESVACLNKALNHLKDIWEEIGIPEDQRLQRVEAVHMHVKVSDIANTSSAWSCLA